jgi:hypothetical protein
MRVGVWGESKKCGGSAEIAVTRFFIKHQKQERKQKIRGGLRN